MFLTCDSRLKKALGDTSVSGIRLSCSHPDLNNKDGAEFLRISAAYQRLLNKNIIIDAPRSPRTHYKSHVRAYPGRLYEHIASSWFVRLSEENCLVLCFASYLVFLTCVISSTHCVYCLHHICDLSDRSAGPVRPFNQTAVTLWGLGLSMGCVLFGTILLWNRVESTGVPIKGPSRVIEPTSNAIKRERISALLLEKSKRPKDSEEWKLVLNLTVLRIWRLDHGSVIFKPSVSDNLVLSMHGQLSP